MSEAELKVMPSGLPKIISPDQKSYGEGLGMRRLPTMVGGSLYGTTTRDPESATANETVYY